MAGNVVFRGPIERQPRTIGKPVTGALLPGSIVEETATNLVALTTAVAKRPLVLGFNDYSGQDLVTAYVTGASGIAFEPLPNDVYNVRMAAATYTWMQPLTVGASGRLTAATAASIVVGWYADTPGTVTADALRDVIWANSYTAD